jgi:hypothetical protein
LEALKPVDVADRQAVAAAVALAARVQDLEVLVQRSPVPQLGQRVPTGQLPQFGPVAGELGVQERHPLGRDQPCVQVEQADRLDEIVVRSRLHARTTSSRSTNPVARMM